MAWASLLAAPAFATPPFPVMSDSPAPTCHLDWQARRQANRLEIAPLITCDRPCRLRFLLATVDSPTQSLRQSGSLQLAAATPRLLGRMVLAAPAPTCRVQLTLWHENGREERFETDTCSDPTWPSPAS